MCFKIWDTNSNNRYKSLYEALVMGRYIFVMAFLPATADGCASEPAEDAPYADGGATEPEEEAKRLDATSTWYFARTRV